MTTERIGRYELQDLLGEGGAGRVHRAVRHGPGDLRSPVALKVLHGEEQSLYREARIGALLRHRHVVDVYDVGEVDGTVFCAMELCDGSLLDRLPLSPRAVVEVGRQVCAALGYAHDALGLVHLDLKPANLLHRDGEVKVADLGIAHAAGFDALGGLRGTPGYMAPEQRQGAPIDARMDVYALGRTLTTLATGRPPVVEETLDLDLLDAPDTPGPADVPEWLAPVVARCVDDDPDQRWPDMAAVDAALQRLEVDGPGLDDLLDRRARPPAQAPAPRPLVGRDALRSRVTDALDTTGAVVLHGMAGIGKSHVAAVVAAEHDGATLRLDLGGIRSEVALAGALGQALGVDGAQPDTVGHALHDMGDVWVVLDPMEHLPEQAVARIARWRSAAPGARWLLVSRRPLHALDATAVPVPPLPPTAALELLGTRAAARGVDVDDDPTGRDQLLSALDGLPLAIELAAGRLGVLTMGELAERLDPALLRGPADGRHGSLHAALDATWALLSPEGRAALAQLAVFEGGADIEAARAVIDVEGDALDALDDLVRAGLVATEAARLTLLAPVRAWARERGPLRHADARHARWFARLDDDAIRTRLHHGHTSRRPWQANLDNLLLAARWTDDEVAAHALLAAEEVAADAGRRDELRVAGRALLARPQLTGSLRARVANLVGCALLPTGERDHAAPLFHEAEQLARTTNDLPLLAATLINTASLAHQQQQPLAEHAALTEAERAARLAGDLAAQASAVVCLAHLAVHEGRRDEAQRHAERAWQLATRTGQLQARIAAAGALAQTLRHQGHLLDALDVFAAGLGLARKAQRRADEAMFLSHLGQGYAAAGQPRRAIPLLREGVALCRRLGHRLGEAYLGLALGGALARLGDPEAEERLAAAWRQATALAHVTLLAKCEIARGRHALEQGRVDEADDWARRALDRPQIHALERAHALVLRGRIASACGRPAASWFRDAVDWADRSGDALPQSRARAWLGRTVGGREGATLLDEAERLAGEVGEVLAEVAALRAEIRAS